MAKIEYKTSNSHVEVEQDDLNAVRAGMLKMYGNHGGRHALTESSSLVYESLDEIFKSRFQELDAEVYLKPGDERRQCYSPGQTFLRDLFYSKVKAKKMKSKQSNFDLCFFFAFGISLQQYTKEKRAAKGTSVTSAQKQMILSSISMYNSERDNLQKYMEVKIGKAVARDLRDVKDANIGPLFTFHLENPDIKTPAVYLIGKGHFFNEDCLMDLIRLSKELKDSFKRNARIVFHDDVWQGDHNLKNTTGILRLTEYWHGHISFMEEQANKRRVEEQANKRKGIKISAEQKDLVKKVNADIMDSTAKTKIIIAEIPPLISYLLNDVKNMPYNYFMNNVTKEEVEHWLSIPPRA